MTARDFCFWLQGYLEVSSVDGSPSFSHDQVECVQKHLALVFKHEIDPSMPSALLDAIHAAQKPPAAPPARPPAAPAAYPAAPAVGDGRPTLYRC